MPPEMWVPGLVMVIGFYMFFAFTATLRMRSEIIEREKGSAWVKEYMEKQNVL